MTGSRSGLIGSMCRDERVGASEPGDDLNAQAFLRGRVVGGPLGSWRQRTCAPVIIGNLGSVQKR